MTDSRPRLHVEAGVAGNAQNGDVNDDGDLDISDPVYLVLHLFKGGPAPVPCADRPELVTRLAELEAELARKSAALEGCSADLSSLQADLAAKDAKLTTCQADLAMSQAALASSQENLSVCQARLATFGPAIEGFAFNGVNAQGYPEYRHVGTAERIGTDMVFVLLSGADGGEIRFQMGSPETECGRVDNKGEGPVHEVRLSPYLIAKHECTQAVWEAIMGSNPSSFRGNPELPVERVSWNDIQEFERRTGLKLPSEAQWENACRGGTTTPFAFGETLDSVTQANFWSGSDVSCNFDSGSQYLGKTAVVGSYATNALGIHDMHGNVREWCEDVYDFGFYAKPEAGGPDPVSTLGSVSRVFRGGDWGDYAWRCRSAARESNDPADRHYRLGFRPARSLPAAPVSSLPDTGQKVCYDFVLGVGWSEVPCGEATCLGQDGSYATGCSTDARFTDNGDGTVTDNCTGLMWQKDTADVNGNGQSTDQDYMRWCDALAYCENLSFAGHDDWRLPNIRELHSIVDYGRVSPAINPVFGAFSAWYWSSTSLADYHDVAWIVYFGRGGVDDIGKDGNDFVRAVRG